MRVPAAGLQAVASDSRQELAAAVLQGRRNGLLQPASMKGDTTGNTLSAHSKSVAHKAVPRWLRMSVRIALLVGVVAVPALAVKEPSFVNLFKYRNYSIAFMVLGTLVLPIWEPNLGMVVVIFTLLIPSESHGDEAGLFVISILVSYLGWWLFWTFFAA